MLKNYVVTMENVEVNKQDKLINYMVNDKHKNHTNTKIISECNSDEYRLNLLGKIHNSQMNYAKNKKGGRPLKRIAKTLIFNLPKYYECNEYELEKIDKMLRDRISALISDKGVHLNLNDLYSAAHFQSNSHIHLIVPMVDNQGKNIREFNRKSFLTELKVIFTETVDEVLKTDISQTQTLPPEQNEHNRLLNELHNVKSEYEYLLKTDLNPKAIKFLENAIIKIDRMIENSEDEFGIDIGKVNKDIDKVNKALSSNISTVR